MKFIFKSFHLIGSVVLFASFFCSCKNKIEADLLVYNGTIYTVDSAFSKAEVLIIKNGKIIFVGKNDENLQQYHCKDSLNLNGKFVYPGFIDAHCHFYGFGLELNKVDLMGSQSWSEVLQRCSVFTANHSNSKWIEGRGWDQNIWAEKKFPTNEKLNELFPNQPVFIRRIDGHAAIANDCALRMANINAATKIVGGEIVLDNNKLTGLLIDNAMSLIERLIPIPNQSQIDEALLAAQQKCFSAGLTTLADAGLPLNIIQAIDSLQLKEKLQMRIYAMVTDDSISKNYFFNHGKLKTDKLNVCAVKYYADGALGSRGACLKHGYADRKNHFGFLLHNKKYFEEQAKLCYEKGFQMNVHAIGDSAILMILQVMSVQLKTKNNRRWRIEHAQILDTADLHYFSTYSILPSIQPTFATSDLNWAMERVGKKYFTGAYLLKSLFKYASQIPFGSDFPVESFRPLDGMYAAVNRTAQDGLPINGFKPEEKINVVAALRGYTIDAAYACMEEKEKGSLEKNKWADFIVFENDILKVDSKKINLQNLLQTWVAGKKVFQK